VPVGGVRPQGLFGVRNGVAVPLHLDVGFGSGVAGRGILGVGFQGLPEIIDGLGVIIQDVKLHPLRQVVFSLAQVTMPGSLRPLALPLSLLGKSR
jgi:hypothetical protein